MNTVPKNESPKANKKKIQWQPLLMEMGKGFLIGASMSLGGIVVDRSFASLRRDRTLTLIPGGNQKAG